jgi:hypothetical protein
MPWARTSAAVTGLAPATLIAASEALAASIDAAISWWSASINARYFSMAMPHDGHCHDGAVSVSLRA